MDHGAEDLDEDARTSDEEVTLTDDQASRFDMLRPMMDSAYKEMGELSKKKQDGVVNELKIRHINRLLGPVRILRTISLICAAAIRRPGARSNSTPHASHAA
jgi:hypothetical protein